MSEHCVESQPVTKTAVEKLGRGLNIYITDPSSESVNSIRCFT